MLRVICVLFLSASVVAASSSHREGRFTQRSRVASTARQHPKKSEPSMLSLPDNRLMGLRGGGAGLPTSASSFKELLLPAVGVSSATWLMFASDIITRSNNQKSKESRLAIAMMSKELKAHRGEKLQSLRQTLVPALLTLIVACVKAKVFPWDPQLWEYGPRPSLIGLNFGFWVAEITMDTCLDECESLHLNTTKVTTAILQLALIVMLTTTHNDGHALFWMKAAETLIATALARVLDSFYWVVIAGLAVGFLAIGGSMGFLATPPKGVPTSGIVAYFVATVWASTMYQVVQNVSSVKIKNVKLLRTLACGLATCCAGTPPSWIVYDAINFALFFFFKVVTDSVALQALQCVR
jgi:hypothetical protein